jgi:prophage tail gpP-like protein
VSYTADVATWRDPSGALWAPNTTVKVEYADAMVYSEYEFLIRDVNFEQNAYSEVARLALVLPGSFTGEAPDRLPWDE